MRLQKAQQCVSEKANFPSMHLYNFYVRFLDLSAPFTMTLPDMKYTQAQSNNREKFHDTVSITVCFMLWFCLYLHFQNCNHWANKRRWPYMNGKSHHCWAGCIFAVALPMLAVATYRLIYRSSKIHHVVKK